MKIIFLGLMLLVPALSGAPCAASVANRAAASRAASAAHERSIVRNCITYARKNQQYFPPNLATLVSQGYIKPKILVAPGSGTRPANLGRLRAKQLRDVKLVARLLQGHCDYVYVGAGLTVKTAQSGSFYGMPGLNGSIRRKVALGEIVIYEKPGLNGGKDRNVGFGDGHVRWIVEWQFEQLRRVWVVLNRTISSANERGIVQSCVIYAVKHQKNFPPNLATLVSQGYATPGVLVAPGSGTMPANLGCLNAKKLRDVQLVARLLQGHCDYVYVGADLTTDTATSKTIVIYEKRGLNGGVGRNVGFGDDHVNWETTKGLPETFHINNLARRAAGLPPIKLDGQPPVPTDKFRNIGFGDNHIQKRRLVAYAG